MVFFGLGIVLSQAMYMNERRVTIMGAVVLAVVVAGSLVFFTSRPGDLAYSDTEIVVEKKDSFLANSEVAQARIVQEVIEATPEPTPQVAADMIEVMPTAETGVNGLTLIVLFGMILVGAFGLRQLRAV